jgi:hypothetical protein
MRQAKNPHMNTKNYQLVEQVENLLDKLTKDELHLLNKAIVKRIRIMNDLRRMTTHAAFSPGDSVIWHDKQVNYWSGRVLRNNTKTISVDE